MEVLVKKNKFKNLLELSNFNKRAGTRIRGSLEK